MLVNVNEKLVLRSAGEADFDNIADVANKRFGDGYLDKTEYMTWICNTELCLVAEYDGVFAGYAYLMPESPGDTAKYMKLDESYVKSVSDGKQVIHCRSAALVSEFERKEIMYELLRCELENAKKLGFGAAFAPAWMYSGFIPMKNNMRKLGFTQIAVKERLWYDVENYKCIICGGRCSCDAVIYEKKL